MTPDAPTGIAVMKKAASWLGAALSLAIFAGALVILHRALQKHDLADVLDRLVEIPHSAIALSFILGMASYFALGGFDWLALRYLGRSLPLWRVQLVSFISHAISHSAGFAALTGGSIRYRMYSAAGLSVGEVAGIVVFCGVTFVVGATFLAATAMIAEPGRAAELLPVAPPVVRAVGVVVLAIILIYLLAGAWLRRPLRLRGWAVSVPPPRTTLAQIAVAAADLGFVAAALYVLLPPETQVSYLGFLGIYVIANLAGLITHVPGGLGVFEGAVLVMVPEARADAVMGALLVFRVLYNLVPLALGALLLTGYETLSGLHLLRRTTQAGRLWMRELEPPSVAVIVFAAGATVVISAAAPTLLTRAAWLEAVFATPVVELWHLVASLIGLGLLLVARGLHRRLRSAHHAATALLAAGIAAVLLRGLDYGVAGILAASLLLVVTAHAGFYRRATLLSLGPSAGWTAAVGAVLVASLWVFLKSYPPAAWSLWAIADSGLGAMAGRSLRAVLAVWVGALVFGALLVTRPRTPVPAPPSAAERAAAIAIARHHRPAFAVLEEWPRLLFGGGAVLPLEIHGRSWVALGDPIGPERDWLDLAWRFRDLCEANAALPVFYAVANRPLYVDLGLSLVRVGDDVRIAVAEFAGDGRGRAVQQESTERMAHEGVTVAVADESDGAAVIASRADAPLCRLRLWLARERGEAGLAGLWCLPDCPSWVLEAALLEALAWAARAGLVGFELGLVPGPQPATTELALLHRQVPAALRRGGEAFRRSFIERLRPDWRPRYLAVPALAALPELVAELSRTLSRRRSSG